MLVSKPTCEVTFKLVNGRKSKLRTSGRLPGRRPWASLTPGMEQTCSKEEEALAHWPGLTAVAPARELVRMQGVRVQEGSKGEANSVTVTQCFSAASVTGH
eukprot:1158472-Pelagomonas_calceolata.AAC.1